MSQRLLHRLQSTHGLEADLERQPNESLGGIAGRIHRIITYLRPRPLHVLKQLVDLPKQALLLPPQPQDLGQLPMALSQALPSSLVAGLVPLLVVPCEEFDLTVLRAADETYERDT